MAKSIDERIVQMTFKNDGFETKAKQTINTLTNLRESTEDNISGNFLNSLTNNLKPFEMAVFGFFESIGQRAELLFERLARNLVKSLTDPIEIGWTKYNEAIASQQVIMSAVSGKKDSEGNLYDMQAVTDEVEDLKWYSDETSYSISQMTEAIGSFTASGVDLKVAKNAVMGISNACADAGVSIQKAGSAFIGFSKAIGSGHLSLGAWNMQLKTSGITNSERFRNVLLESAYAMKTLGKNADGTYRILYGTKAGDTVTAGNITEYFNEGIVTSEVLIDALNKYSDTTLKVKEMTEGNASAITDIYKNLGKEIPSDVQEIVKTVEEGGLTASEAIESLKESYKKAGIEIPLSLDALARAQEAISFTQAIDSAKDAINTQWSNVFEAIFGNYEETKKLWTRLANDLNEWIVTPFYNLADLMADWKNLWDSNEMDYGKSVTQTFAVYRAFSAVISEINRLFSEVAEKSGINELLPNAQSIFDYIEKIRNGLWDIYTYVGQTVEYTSIAYVEKALIGISSAIKMLISSFKVIDDSFIGPLFDRLKPLRDEIFSIFADIGDILYGISMDQINDDFSGFRSVLSSILSLAQPFIDFIKMILDTVKEITTNLKNNEKLTTSLTTIFSNLSKILSKLLKPLESISNAVRKLFESFNLSETIVKAFDILSTAATFLFDKIKSLTEIVKEFFSYLSNDGGEYAALSIAGVVVAFKKFLDVKWWIEAFNIVKNVFSNLMLVIGDTINDLQWAFESTSLKNYAKVFIKIAAAILILAIAMKTLSNIDSEGMKRAFGALTAISTALLIFYYAMNKLNGLNILTGKDESKGFFGKIGNIFSSGKKAFKAKDLIKIALSILLVAAALKLMSGINAEEMSVALKGLVVSLLALGAFLVLVNKFGKSFAGMSMIGRMLVMLGISLIALSVALKIMATIPIEQMGVALLGLIGGLAAIFGFMVGISKLAGAGNFALIAASMLILAPSLLVLSAVLKILGTMNWEEIGKALVALVGSLAIIGLIPALIGLIPGSQASLLVFAASMLILVPALLGLVGVLKLLSMMEWSEIGKGLGMIAAILATLGIESAILGIVSPLILLFAGSLLVLGKALESIGKGLTTLLSAVALFKIMGEGTVKTILTIFESIVAGIVALIPMILVGIVDAVITVSGRLLELAVELVTILCDSLIQSIPKICETFIAVITAILDTITVLFPKIIETGHSLLLSLVKGIKDHISEVVALGVEIISQIIMGIQKSLSILIKGIEDTIKGIIDSVIAVSERLLEIVVEFITNLCDSLIQLIPKICETVVTVITAILDAITVLLPRIMEAGYSLLLSLLKGIRDHISEVITLGAEIISQIIIGIQQSLNILIEAGFKVVIDFLNGVADTIRENAGDMGAAFGNFASAVIEGMINGLVSALSTFGEKLVDFGKGVITSIKEFFTGKKDESKEAGAVVVDSIEEGIDEKKPDLMEETAKIGEESVESIEAGITDNKQDLIDSISEMTDEETTAMDGTEGAKKSGQNTIDGLLSTLTSSANMSSIFNAGLGAAAQYKLGFDTGLDEHSPSREMAKRGKFAILGLIAGLKNNSNLVEEAGTNTGLELLDSFSYAVDKAEDVLNEEVNPVITPVLDLSKVREKAGILGSLLNQNGELSSALGLSNNPSGFNQNVINIDFSINNEGKDITDVDINKWGDILVDKINNALGNAI